MKPFEQLEAIKDLIKSVTTIEGDIASNPMFSVRINLKTGELLGRNDRILKDNGGFYTLSIDTLDKSVSISIDRILSLFLGIDLPKGHKFVKKDESKGYHASNLQVVYTQRGRNVGSSNKIKEGDHSKQRSSKVQTISTSEVVTEEVVIIDDFKLLESYTTPGFYTLDGERFSNIEDAEDHDEKIKVAQKACQLLINQRAGWSVAETIFKTIVGVNQNTSYQNFKDIVSSTQDIKEVTSSRLYRFVKDPRFDDMSKEILEARDLSIKSVREIILQLSMIQIAKRSIIEELSK